MRRSSCSTRLAEPGRKGGRKPYGTPEEGMGASEPPRPPPPPRPPGPRPPRPPPRPTDRPPELLSDDIFYKLQYELATVPPLVCLVSILSSHQQCQKRCCFSSNAGVARPVARWQNALSVDSLPFALLLQAKKASHPAKPVLPSSQRSRLLKAYFNNHSFAIISYHLDNKNAASFKHSLAIPCMKCNRDPVTPLPPAGPMHDDSF